MHTREVFPWGQQAFIELWRRFLGARKHFLGSRSVAKVSGKVSLGKEELHGSWELVMSARDHIMRAINKFIYGEGRGRAKYFDLREG